MTGSKTARQLGRRSLLIHTKFRFPIIHPFIASFIHRRFVCRERLPLVPPRGWNERAGRRSKRRRRAGRQRRRRARAPGAGQGNRTKAKSAAGERAKNVRVGGWRKNTWVRFEGDTRLTSCGSVNISEKSQQGGRWLDRLQS